MSDFQDPQPDPARQQPANVIPVTYSSKPRKPPLPWGLRALLVVLLVDLVGCNVFVMLMAGLVALGAGLSDSTMSDTSIHVRERFHSGKTSAKDRIAILHIDGVLMEGLTTFAQKEIERAAADDSVKAVVLRINSPGGTITASDDLHKRITQLRDGDPAKKTQAKPVIVSMGGLAASGGYYIAMPAKTLVAERTTITGSIGVYASLPNFKELGDKYGFHLEIIKAGEVKDSGSMFKEMTPHERQLWQTMVDRSYLQFIQVVEQGRPQLKGKLQENIDIDETLPVRDEKATQKHLNYTRYRADGGIFMAEEAKKHGLIDQIGYLDDAIQVAKQTAGLGEDYKAISYERPLTLMGALLGEKSQPPAMNFDVNRLSSGLVPRLWYLAPQSELAGLLAAAGRN